jgi:hypothetical protein
VTEVEKVGLWRRLRPKPHICLAARALSTVEHLGAIARQAETAGLDLCWLDLADEPGIAAAIRTYADADASPLVVASAEDLSGHIHARRSVAVWIQSPYPEHYPEWFWTSVAGRVAYAGYGLTLSTWEAGLYDLTPYRDAAWLVTESRDTQEGYIARGVDPARVLLVGNPLLAELRLRDGRELDRPFKILWAPHWSEDWFGGRGYSRWRETVGPVLRYAQEHPRSRVLVRPHPLLPPAVARAPDDDAAAAAFRELSNLPNAMTSTGRLVDDILSSKALVTDGVSIIAYWSATGRPLGVTRDADSPPLNAVGQALVAAAALLDSPERVTSWLETAPDAPLDERRRALSAEFHPTFDTSPIALWDQQRRGARRRA